MKYFIALVMTFFSTVSLAMKDNDVYVTNNQDGGKIYLFAGDCPLPESKGARISFTTSSNGEFVGGCWILYEDEIYVIWLPQNEQPVRAKYDTEIFTLEKIV